MLVKRKRAYGALALAAARRNKYARTALMMYNTGRRFAPYARTAIRLFRGRRGRNKFRKAKLRTRIGERVGTGNAKSNRTLNLSTGVDTRTLYDEPLLNLDQGTGRNQRERGVVNFRGVKICMSFQNLNGAATKPDMYVNVAVISPKAEDSGTIALPVANFFRAAGTDRGTNFGTALTAIQFRCLPINTDLYNVHKHKRLNIGNVQDTARTNSKTLEFYVKLNRQIRYEGTTSTPTGKNMYLVWWCDIQSTPTAGPVITNAMNLQMDIIQYFHESKKCC